MIGRAGGIAETTTGKRTGVTARDGQRREWIAGWRGSGVVSNGLK